MYCIPIVFRRGCIDYLDLMAGAGVVVRRSRFLVVGIGARCGGLRPAMDGSTFGMD